METTITRAFRVAAASYFAPARHWKQLIGLWALLAAVIGAPVLCARGLSAQSTVSADERLRIDRLAGLARVWGEAKYFHPELASPDVDWDSAVVAAVRDVNAAENTRDYARAIQEMLERLDDPLTRIASPIPTSAADHTRFGEFGIRFTEDSILVVTAGDYYALSSSGAIEGLQQLSAVIPRARAVVFDLRSDAPTDAFGRMQLAASFAEVQRLVTTDTLHVAAEQRRVYHGLANPSPFSSGQYRSGFFVETVSPIAPSPRAVDIATVFVVNRNSALLPAAAPLQTSGRGRIVYEGDLARHTIGDVITVPLPEGVQAQIRRSALVFPDGTSGAFDPDTIVAEQAGVDHASLDRDGALDAALAMARSAAPGRRIRVPVAATAAPLREQSYADAAYPDSGYRLLAAFRFWNAIEHFYPYKHLLDRDWDSVLPELIPLFETARDAREYTLAVAEMARSIQDSHAYLSGAPVDEHLVGPGYPPIRVRSIEGELAVTAIYDSATARVAGIAAGDVVIAVDGTPAGERLAETARHLSSSTPQSRLDRATLTFMNGPVGSTVGLTLRDAQGALKEIRLERIFEDFNTLYHRERSGEVVQMLPGNIGYVDLDRLTYDMVDPMFERLGDTRAIIFDMRGYPRGTAWAIAPRLARQARAVARFTTPMPGHSSPAPAGEHFLQNVVPEPAVERYRGCTVMLIDERTVSQAEHTGLYLEAANGTRFVGSSTAGANGEITSITLPGGITVGFTGQEVRFPDGRQLQRVGLTPHVVARPTLAGIRAGRDEVLEAALRLLGGSEPRP